MKVFVYYNLHKQKWSIRHKGIVIAHADEVVLTGAKFKVSEAGRQRVLREKRKNVHAGVEGNLDLAIGVDEVSFLSIGLAGRAILGSHIEHLTHQIIYNPYHNSTFIYKDNDYPVFYAPTVTFKAKTVWV